MNKLITGNYSICLFRHIVPATSSVTPSMKRFSSNKKELMDPKRRSPSKFKQGKVPSHVKLLLEKEERREKPIDVFYDIKWNELVEALVEKGEDKKIIRLTMLTLDPKNQQYISNNDLEMPRDLVAKITYGLNYKPNFKPRHKKKINNVYIASLELKPQKPPPPEECVRRAPVVTIMGHVDHGKTTLLDQLRKTRVVDEEAGGITQHIGAFSVKLPDSEKRVTFIDTPGHAAFKKMRQNGVNSTDIVVLVIAADDGIMDQTIESINYAKAAGASFVIAINKCDKKKADPERVKQELLNHDIVVEELGGDTQCVEISALKGENLVGLQEAIIAQAEIMDLKTTPNGLVEGHIIESKSSAPGIPIHQGPVATCIVQRGTLKRGDFLIAGDSMAIPAKLFDEFGKPIHEAGPSTPVQIGGWERHILPHPGDHVFQVETRGKAKQVNHYRYQKKMWQKTEDTWEMMEKKHEEDQRVYREKRLAKLRSGERYKSLFSGGALIAERTEINKQKKEHPELFAYIKPKLSLMIKTDVDGTLEAILGVLDTYDNKDVDLDLADFGIGQLKEDDVELASMMNTHIFVFNLEVPKKIKTLAEQKNVEIREFTIIYELVDVLKDMLSQKLTPEKELKVIGDGHVLKEFIIKHGDDKIPIAGVLVNNGHFTKDAVVRIKRPSLVKGETETIYQGTIESMKIERQLVERANVGQEVGISLDDRSIRFKPNDIVEILKEDVVYPRIDWNPPGF